MKEELAKDIVLKMLETKSILLECQSTDNPSAAELSEINQRNANMVGSVFSTICQTVKKTKKREHEN